MWFKTRPTVDTDEQEWLLAAWRWLDDVMGAVEGDDTLWLPTHEHFPRAHLTGDDLAKHDFELVKGKCGMATWPTRLVAQRARPLLPATMAHNAVVADDPGGTFRIDGETAVITYDPAETQASETVVPEHKRARRARHSRASEDVPMRLPAHTHWRSDQRANRSHSGACTSGAERALQIRLPVVRRHVFGGAVRLPCG